MFRPNLCFFFGTIIINSNNARIMDHIKVRRFRVDSSGSRYEPVTDTSELNEYSGNFWTADLSNFLQNNAIHWIWFLKHIL